MEVTRANFQDLLPTIRQKIEECDFIAIDTEFTGLSAGPQQEYSLLDTPAKRYTKLRHTVQQFILCQIGITTFTNDQWKNKYEATSFNFYIFPHEFDDIDRRFSVQVSSFQFLCRHDFDFNKFVYGGIPYLSGDEEARLREQQEQSGDASQAEFEQHLSHGLGFSHVFKMLVQARKPILGHNMLMDLLFMFDKFHQPLPVSYEQFKRELHGLFPCILDSKHVACEVKRDMVGRSAEFFRSTVLSELHALLTSKACREHAMLCPSILLDSSCSRYSDVQYHEAGYDSYVSGVVLIHICHLVARQTMSSYDTAATSWPKICHMTEIYMNCVNMIRCSVYHINVAGPDPNSCRPWLVLTSRTLWGKISQEEVMEALSSSDFLDVEMNGSSRCLIAAGTEKGARRIESDFANHPDYAVCPYTAPLLPPASAPMLWFGAVGVSAVAALYYLHKTGRVSLAW